MSFTPLSEKEESVARKIVDAAYAVHKTLGGCPRTQIFAILGNSEVIISMGYECKFHEKAILGQPPRTRFA